MKEWMKKYWPWAFVAVAFIVGGPIIINELYKTGKGYMTLWDAADMLSYYGTSLAAFLTAGSILIAIWQYKQPLIKKVRISFTSGFVVMSNNTLGDTIHCISISNTGIRPVIITNVYLHIGDKNMVINNLQYPDLPMVDFPHKIDQEENLEMRLPCNLVSNELSKFVSKKVINQFDSVKIVATDSTGGTHVYSAKIKVKELISIRD